MVVEPDDVAFLPVKVTHLLIGASPDAIIEHETVLEIKCPFVVRNQMINIKNSTIHLNKPVGLNIH
jgi:hypothetical protein